MKQIVALLYFAPQFFLIIIMSVVAKLSVEIKGGFGFWKKQICVFGENDGLHIYKPEVKTKLT